MGLSLWFSGDLHALWSSHRNSKICFCVGTSFLRLICRTEQKSKTNHLLGMTFLFVESFICVFYVWIYRKYRISAYRLFHQAPDQACLLPFGLVVLLLCVFSFVPRATSKWTGKHLSFKILRCSGGQVYSVTRTYCKVITRALSVHYSTAWEFLDLVRPVFILNFSLLDDPQRWALSVCPQASFLFIWQFV